MIDRFDGEYRFLSNFWPCKVLFDGDEYLSVENGYQAAKTLDPGERKNIRMSTAGQAKRYGKIVRLRPDWSMHRLAVMTDLVWQKFQDPELARKLLATGNQKLVEGNVWGDTFWGACNGIGRNHLGMILMQVRAELKAKT